MLHGEVTDTLVTLTLDGSVDGGISRTPSQQQVVLGGVAHFDPECRVSQGTLTTAVVQNASPPKTVRTQLLPVGQAEYETEQSSLSLQSRSSQSKPLLSQQNQRALACIAPAPSAARTASRLIHPPLRFANITRSPFKKK
jgi:hypothetical protein